MKKILSLTIVGILFFSSVYSQQETTYWYEGSDLEITNEPLSEKRIKRQNLVLTKMYQELDGKYHGSYIMYYDNGNMRSHRMFLNGEKVGLHTEYYSNGVLKTEKAYKKGTQYGIYKSYYSSGKPKVVGNYVLGYKEGEFLFYDEDGVVTKESFNFATSYEFDSAFDDDWATSICDCDLVIYESNYLTNFQWKEKYREFDWNDSSCSDSQVSNNQYIDYLNRVWKTKTIIECGK
jgi:hypothetical protein